MSESAEEISSIRPVPARRRASLADFLVRLVKEKPMGAVGAVIVLIMLFTGIFADVLAPYGMNQISLVDRLTGPSGEHILGTDNLGRDLFSRIIFGARISMYVGLAAAFLDVLGATIIGIISGFIGGRTDLVIQRFVDAWMCFPGLVIFLTVISIVGPGLVQVILVLGLSSSIRSSRVVRSAVMNIKENMYVHAAVSIGAPTSRILVKHILPNIMAPIIIIFTLAMGSMIVAEASLSFLGFGIPPPTPSWGGMLSGSGRTYMENAPWMAIFPGLALAIVVYGINMLGDAVRDLLDPRMRGGLGRYSGVKTKGRAKEAQQAADAGETEQR